MIDPSSLELVNKINQRLVGTLNFAEMAQKVTALLTDELDLQGGGVFRVEPEFRRLRACALASKSNTAKLLQSLGKPFTAMTTPIDHPVNFMGRTVALGKSFRGNVLRDFICPTVSPSIADAIQKLAHADYLFSLPIKYKGNIVGALLTGQRDRDVSEQEISMLEAFTAQLGLAMGNVMAHERIIERYKESLRQGEKKVAKIPKIKFTLRITPEIEQYLTFKVANTKESKAEYVRKLLEELMEKDEGYKKLRGPQ